MGETVLEVYHLNDNIGVGSPPECEKDLQQLVEAGFQAILNVLEPNVAIGMAARDEALAAKSRNLFYLNFPVDDDISDLDVHQFCTKLELLPPPTYVHGSGDGKAAALAVIAVAKKNQWSAEQAHDFIASERLACRKGDWSQLVHEHVA